MLIKQGAPLCGVPPLPLSLSLLYIPLQIIEAAVATVTAKDAILSQISTPKGNIV